MTQKQLKLFQKVLEQMKNNLIKSFLYYVENNIFEGGADYCVEGLENVSTLSEWVDRIDNDAIPNKLIDFTGWDDDTLRWILIDVFGINDCGEIGIINEVNKEYGLCTDDEVQEIIDELKDIYEHEKDSLQDSQFSYIYE